MITTRHLTPLTTPLTLVVATLAAAFLVQGAKAAPPVVRLEPVHVTAQRLPAGRVAVVQLPAVEVVGRRTGDAASRSGVAHIGHRVGAEIGSPQVRQHADGRVLG